MVAVGGKQQRDTEQGEESSRPEAPAGPGSGSTAGDEAEAHLLGDHRARDCSAASVTRAVAP